MKYGKHENGALEIRIVLAPDEAKKVKARASAALLKINAYVRMVVLRDALKGNRRD